MFADRGGGAIPCGHVHEKMNAQLAKVMKHDGTGARDQSDQDEIDCPFARMGEFDRPFSPLEGFQPRRCFSGPCFHVESAGLKRIEAPAVA
jgi:hypothetical protein